MDDYAVIQVAKANAAFKETKQQQSNWALFQQQMEEALFNQKVESFAQMTLKEKALEELRKVDPNNPILIQKNRERIREEIEENARKTGKTGLD